MQPNENMPGAGQAAGPTRPVAPANPVKPVNPVTPLKPVEPAGGPTFDNGPSVVEGKGGKKTGWIMAVVLLLIVAAGGVGFGVWAWMDGNTQKDALNSQISALKQQNSDLQEQVGNEVVIDADIDTEAWSSFSNNFSNSLDGKITNSLGGYWHYTGSDNVRNSVVAQVDQNGHLTITDYGNEDDSEAPGSIMVELDNVLTTYFVEVGNGGEPYFYIIMAEDGSVRRIDVSEYSNREIEKVGDYSGIVSVIKSGLEAVLVNIDGNTYRTF